MNTRPTPETNELVKTQLARVGMTPSVLAAKLTIKCESLERERDEAREIIAAALKALPVGYLPAHTPESIPARIEDLCKTIVETERELAEARETIDTMEIRHAAVMLHTQDIVDEANQFRDQRDRLAVALREIRKGITEPTHHRRGTLEIANEALAAVKGGEQ